MASIIVLSLFTGAPVDTEQVTDSIETFVGQPTGIEIIEAGIRQVED